MSEDTRGRILKAAEQEFSAKGFDGARVDQIAAAAQVNKALIYYYFGSKQKILDALYQDLVDRGIADLDLSRFLPEALEGDPNSFQEIFGEILGFFSRYRDIIRVVFMESLKRGGENRILQLVDVYYDERIQTVVRDLQAKGTYIEENKVQWIVTEFFTGMLPVIGYVLFREDLAEHLGSDSAALDGYFMQSIRDTHLPTHMPKENGDETE
jgi:AcrR family transcriptional regulator